MRKRWLAIPLVAGCDGRVVGYDVVGRVVATERTVVAEIENREDHRDETVEGPCRAWFPECTSTDECRSRYDLSAGPIRIEGLPPEIILEYREFTESYGTYVGSLPYTPDSELRAWAPGDEVDGFALTLGGLEQFADPDEMIMAPAFTPEPITITWTPAATADPDARVELAGYAGTGHAGLDMRFFECISADTGSFTIGPGISAELAAMGDGTGYGGLSRFHETVNVTPGYEVRFRIATLRAIAFGF
jgi:hypothetical protein